MQKLIVQNASKFTLYPSMSLGTVLFKDIFGARAELSGSNCDVCCQDHGSRQQRERTLVAWQQFPIRPLACMCTSQCYAIVVKQGSIHPWPADINGLYFEGDPQTFCILCSCLDCLLSTTPKAEKNITYFPSQLRVCVITGGSAVLLVNDHLRNAT